MRQFLTLNDELVKLFLSKKFLIKMISKLLKLTLKKFLKYKYIEPKKISDILY